MIFFFSVLCVVGLSNARWVSKGRSSGPKDTSFVGEATNELATAMFQVINLIYFELFYKTTKYY